MLEAAAVLVSLGVNVVPLRPHSKVPAAEWKRLQRGRLVDRDWDAVDAFLCAWWDGDSRHGLGAVTGRVSGVVVVDVDDEAGQRRFDELVDDPTTVAVATKRGRHYWFEHPGGELGNKAHSGGVGLDVRADGGFVVVPPTPHPGGGAYRWIVSPLDMWPPAPLPERLLAALWPAPPKLSAPPRNHSGGAYVAAAVEAEALAVRGAVPGTRNETLNKSGFALARFVVSGELAAADLVAALLPAAIAAGLPEHEARRTLASAMSSRAAA